jgi:alpha-beta hydrolase superfamily lysophospholipase
MASSSWIVACALLASDAFGAEAIRIESAHFESHGVTLAGSIAFPAAAPPHAAVVFIHGSGKQTRNLELAQRLARAGIAALVYDKRGAGESGGEYEGNQSVSEQNISLLADDAVAALNALAAHPSLENVPLGFTGISQAGWIAPLAARRSGRTASCCCGAGRCAR